MGKLQHHQENPVNLFLIFFRVAPDTEMAEYPANETDRIPDKNRPDIGCNGILFLDVRL